MELRPSLAVPAFTLLLSAIADAGGHLLHLMWQPGAWWIRLRASTGDAADAGEPAFFLRLRQQVQERGGRMRGVGTVGSEEFQARQFEVTGLGDQVFLLSIPVRSARQADGARP